MTLLLVPPSGGQGPSTPKGRHSPALYLSDAEALRVRNVIRGMRSHLGSLARVADATGLRPDMIKSVSGGRYPASPGVALAVARALRIPVERVLSGKLEAAGKCPTCGRCG